MELEIVEMAKKVLVSKNMFSDEAIAMAEYIISIHKPKPGYETRIHRKLNSLRNHVLEEAAVTVERLEGRVRGEINKETAQHLRKLKVAL